MACMLRFTSRNFLHRRSRMALHSEHTTADVPDGAARLEAFFNPLLAKYVHPVSVTGFPHSGVLTKSVGRTTFSTSACSSSDKQLADFADDLKSNPFFDKYADKINQRIKADPDVVQRPSKSRPTKSEKEIRTQNSTGKTSSAAASSIEHYSAQPNRCRQQTRAKSLDGIIRLDLLRDKSAAEIRHIWNSRHSTKAGNVSAVKPADAYAAECSLAAEYPSFLLPVPREQGVEFFVLQWNGDEAHFTSLLAYQAHGENSPPCMSLYHYGELAPSHRIVLMRGEYDTAMLKPMEAQCLINQLQLYYNSPNEVRRNLLEIFHRRPAEFQHMRLVEEMTRVDAVGPVSVLE